MEPKKLSYRIVSENAWVFPDDKVGTPSEKAVLHIARGGSALIQLVTDCVLDQPLPASLCVNGANGVTVTAYRLDTAHVDQNSAPRGKPNLAENYEDVKDFVTRKAPFDVYDITVPLEGRLEKGRLALAFLFSAAASAPVGKEELLLTLSFGDNAIALPVELHVHKAKIPPLSATPLTVCNWIYPKTLVKDHGVELFSDAYYAVLRMYMEHLLSIRSTVFTMVERTGASYVKVIRDEAGKIVDFDLTEIEKHLRLAREMGFPIIAGPFVALWGKWDDFGLWLLWDRATEVTTPEAYRQLKIYFTRVGEMIKRNRWENCYWQTLVDEPQENNELMYRALACICRRYLPGVTISDPIETTKVGGATDVWSVKQATYEKYIDTYRAYQAIGERMTFYTCGFPAGDTMNRVLDLPLSAGRLTFWMCHRYGLEGFLHWGYHAGVDKNHMVSAAMPAGNQGIVYPAGDTVYESIRSYNQLAGCEDWELLNIIRKADPEKADLLIAEVARTFDDYERDPEKLDRMHVRLLEEADRYSL